MRLCLERAMYEIRQRSSEALSERAANLHRANTGMNGNGNENGSENENNSTNNSTNNSSSSSTTTTTNNNNNNNNNNNLNFDDINDYTNLLSIIQQCPLEHVSLDNPHDLVNKLGDEDYCFVLQVEIISSFHLTIILSSFHHFIISLLVLQLFPRMSTQVD